MNLNRDPKTHLIRIKSINPNVVANILCSHHYMTSLDNSLAAIFKAHYIVNDTSDVEDPSYDQLSFKQELRLWGTGVSMVNVERNKIEPWIKAKMEEVFGNDIQITIQFLEELL